eukprot:EG_transcript_31500
MPPYRSLSPTGTRHGAILYSTEPLASRHSFGGHEFPRQWSDPGRDWPLLNGPPPSRTWASQAPPPFLTNGRFAPTYTDVRWVPWEDGEEAPLNDPVAEAYRDAEELIRRRKSQPTSASPAGPDSRRPTRVEGSRPPEAVRPKPVTPPGLVEKRSVATHLPGPAKPLRPVSPAEFRRNRAEVDSPAAPAPAPAPAAAPSQP